MVKRATKKKAAKSKPIEYDGTNFHKILSHMKKGPIVVVNILVHMDGCGPCQRIMGPYKKAVSKAPSNALNVSVESKKLDQFNNDMQKNVPGSDTLSVKGYPSIINVNTSGKTMNQEFASQSNVGTLTSANSPSASPSAMTPPSEESDLYSSVYDSDDDSISNISNSVPMSQNMSGGRRRTSRKTGRKTGHKTGRKSSRKTRHRSQHRA